MKITFKLAALFEVPRTHVQQCGDHAVVHAYCTCQRDMSTLWRGKRRVTGFRATGDLKKGQSPPEESSSKGFQL